MQDLLRFIAQRHEDLRNNGGPLPLAGALQSEFQTRVQAIDALRRLIIGARADGERLLNLRRTAAQRQAQADIWAAQTMGEEARTAEACCAEWADYIGHIDRDIGYRRQLIVDYQREWQSYRETMADTSLRRTVMVRVTLPPVSRLVLSQMAEDERTYAALARSSEAPARDSGFAIQPEDMEQVNCEIAYLESNQAAALAQRPPAACHSVEPYRRRAADDHDEEEGAASYGEDAAQYAGSGAGAYTSNASSTPSYTAATNDGYGSSAAGQRNSNATEYAAMANPFLAQYGVAQGWTPAPAFSGVQALPYYGTGGYTPAAWPAPASLTPVPWIAPAASATFIPTMPPGWPLAVESGQTLAGDAMESEDDRPRLHGYERGTSSPKSCP
jgi:hypothetical protein